MATYMRIYEVGGQEGTIKIRGDVGHVMHQGWIEILGFDYTGEDEGRRSCTIEKRIDSASCPLMDWTKSGELCDVHIEFCREEGIPFLRARLYEVQSKSFESALDEETATETVGLVYSTFTIEALTATRDGQLQATAVASTEVSRLSQSAVLEADSGSHGDSGQHHGPERKKSKDVQEGIPEHESEQEDRMLVVEDIGGKTLELVKFTGTERVSDPFEFVLDFRSEDFEIEPKDMIGQEIKFRIEDCEDIDEDAASEPRHFHGVIREWHAGLVNVSSRDYSAVVVPWFWFAKQRTDCRIYQNKDVVEILEDVFTTLGIPAFDKSNVRETYEPLEYCVQYHETDFDFANRLMEEFGLFYFFVHSDTEHKMMLADGTTAYQACEPSEVIQTMGTAEETGIHKWETRYRHISGKVTYRDYNYTTPQDSLESEASVASRIDLSDLDKYERYDYPGRYGTTDAGSTAAKIAIESIEAPYQIVAGTSTVETFELGKTFKVTAHDNPAEARAKAEYLLTELKHKVMEIHRDNKPRVSYSNSFECIPKEVVFRSPRRTPRPLIAGPQTAKVVGTSGEEIDTDKYGCVKVQFPWDRLGENDENSSCWIRVAQDIAGAKWGAIRLPRIGQEVVVEFLEGNPDRPLITGSVYNEDNLPPYDLPGNKSQSGFKSRTTKEGGVDNFNELRFEDKKDNELVYFHAEKDFERIVEHDDKHTIGEKDDGSQTITIEKDQTLTLKKGDQTVTIEKGNQSTTITEGTRTTSIKGDDTTTVEEGNASYTISSGNYTTTLDSGESLVDASDKIELKVGDNVYKIESSGAMTGEATDNIELKVGGNKVKIETAGNISVEATTKIELKVGSNKVEISNEGVKISGLTVEAKGDIESKLLGAMVTVKGDAMTEVKGGVIMIG